ncbi:MAG: hypothetical protein ACN4GW_20650 [Desulforhopalus sp.]
MQRTNKIKNILEILASNAQSSAQPGVVDSSLISENLNIPLPETKQLLTTMNDMGVIESNIDRDYSLITSSGLQSLHS